MIGAARSKVAQQALGSMMNRALSSGSVRDIVANYAGTGVSAAVPLIALPFLLRALGQANWGIVSFSTMLVSLLSLLNAGLAQSLVKEIGSRWWAQGNGKARAARLVFSYERIYWVGAVMLGMIVIPFVPSIVAHWLNLGSVLPSAAQSALYASVVLFVVQFPNGLYSAALMATYNQVAYNVIRASLTILRGLCGVAVAHATRSVAAYLAVIVLLTLVETLSMRAWMWTRMRAVSTISWDKREVRASLTFSGKMTLIVVLGVLTTQLDKFFLSAKVDLSELGFYSVASSIAFGILTIGYPLFQALLPRIVAVGNDIRQRMIINLRLMIAVVSAILVATAAYNVLGRFILQIWLGDHHLANEIKRALDPLLIACALNSIYNIGYINWVGRGEARWIFAINVTGFLTAAFVTPIAIDRFGYPGASASLLVLNVIGATCSVAWLSLTRYRLREA